MTLETVKNYLRVDGNDDDSLIQLEIDAAHAYMCGAVSNFTALYEADEAFRNAADVAKLAIIAQLYENRTSEYKNDYSYPIRTIINQLALWGEEA